MQRVYHKYTEWEDYKSGMYRTSIDNETDLIKKSVELLSDKDMFFQVALEVISVWVVSSSENLTNVSSNRRSWIGQASCCYLHGSPEIVTRKAWGLMSNQKRQQANLIADKIIRIYERKNRSLHQRVGETMLF